MKAGASRSRPHGRLALRRGESGVPSIAADDLSACRDLDVPAQRNLDPVIRAPRCCGRRNRRPAILDISEIHARQINAVELSAQLASLARRHIEAELLLYQKGAGLVRVPAVEHREASHERSWRKGHGLGLFPLTAAIL